MRVCVFGLWHLGSVTAACLAAAKIHTVGLDDDLAVIEKLNQGRAPLFEPGLDELLQDGIRAGTLSFTTDAVAAAADADLLWVTFDTPVDDEDRADVEYVISRVEKLFPILRDGAVVLVSSQMPAGSTARLERRFNEVAVGRKVLFAYSPENLRLGKAIEIFTHPERIIIGIRNSGTRTVLKPLLSRFCERLIWISVESAEITKHALNAYLATCVTFINEIATVCERVGADAGEVEMALRSEPRIGPKAYIRPGGAFAGGTLARDVIFLSELGKRFGLSLSMLNAVITSNLQHGLWPLHAVEARLKPLAGHTVAVLGLAYKPGTDAIRRSGALELIRGLLARGVTVRAFDPVVRSLPEEFAPVILAASAAEAMQDASCVVIETEWPEFRNLEPEMLLARLQRPLIIDQNRFLSSGIATHPGIEFVTVGKPL